MHKYAGDLEVGDAFVMAGMLYHVDRLYETVDPEAIKFAFSLLTDSSNRSNTLCIQKATLFSLA